MIREMDNRIATIDLNGNHIIRDCKTMLIFLKEKLTELKGFVQTQPLGMTLTKSPFSSSINRGFWDPCFIFTISCVLRANALWMKRNWMITTKTTGGTKDVLRPPCGVFQYYRSGATYMDNYYFLRGRQGNAIDVDVCQFNDDLEFSTGYDHLVARIMAMEMLYAFLSVKRTYLQMVMKICVPNY